jgi:hypothetical protein
MNITEHRHKDHRTLPDRIAESYVSGQCEHRPRTSE